MPNLGTPITTKHKNASLVAVLCACFVWYGPDSWPYALFMNSSLIIGAIWGAWMRNWFLDDDFCFDVDELGEMINQESAA